MNSFVLRRACGVICSSVLFVGLASAAAQHTAKGNDKNNDDSAATVAQQTAVNGKADKLRAPSKEEIQTLLEGMQSYVNQSTEGLQVKQSPNGAQFVDLEGRFENLALAKVGPDGKVISECVNNKKDAERFLVSTDKPKNSSAPKPPQKSDPSTWEVK